MVVHYRITCAVLLLLAAVSYAIEPGPSAAITLPCRVVSVHDGDTCTIELTTRANIRLLDCWAPELSEGESGQRARQRLAELVEGKEGLVTIPVHETLGKSFTFGRLLARLRVDNRDVSEAMVSEGFATKQREGE